VVQGSAGGLFVISETIPPDLCGLPLPEPSLEIDSAMEARRLFEPHVARLAALYATPADFDRMRSAVQLSEQTSALRCPGKVTDEVARNMTVASTRFNIAVARATQNSVIVQMMEVMMRRMEVVRVMAVRELPDIGLSTQTLVNSLKAIESGDPAQIDQATAERIETLEAAWQRVSRQPLRRRALMSASGAKAGQATPKPPPADAAPAKAAKAGKISAAG
jgi:GntR family transcriptional repressor for pyruvate dehydrogenase complex